ncbi:MAG: S1 RNA-binding domain-containing protein [Nitrososphaerota archaeon]
MAEFIEKDAPSIGEVVVGVVKGVERFGAYVELIDYPGWEGFVHISEISLKWIRNIRDYLREGQKEVFKILRTNPHLHQVDLSLRRVEKNERDQKILELKRKQKVQRVLNLLSERTSMSREELSKVIIEPARERGLQLYDVFLDMVENNSVPEWLKLEGNLINKLIELVKQEIKMKKVSVKKDLVLICRKGDGVEHIRRAIEEALKIVGRGESASITTKGSPRYLLRVEADTEEKAVELLRQIADKCIGIIRECGGEGSLVEES